MEPKYLKNINEQNENLIQALRNRREQSHLSIPRMAAEIGISKGSLEAYLYGYKFPRRNVLEKIARYLDTDVEALLPDTIKPEIKNEYNNRSDVSTFSDSITSFLMTKEYPQHASFLRLLELSGFTFRYIPDLESEIDAMSVRIDIDEQLEIKQQEATFVPEQGSSLGKYAGNSDIQATLDILKSIISSDSVNSVENNIMLELFVKNIDDKVYDDTDIEDLPLSIEIMKIKPSISPKKYDDTTMFKDVLQVPCKTMSIADFLNLEIDLIDQLETSLIKAIKNL